LRFLDSGSGKQEITGRIGRIGNSFRHQRAPGTNEASMSVHHMFPSRRANTASDRKVLFARSINGSLREG
jgi:hypothetical protein